MSKRVSIATPEEMGEEQRATISSKSPTASPPKSPRMSSASPPESQAKAADETKATSDSALVKSNTEEEVEPFSDDCERYQKDCCCCHCVAVRCALKRAAFLRTPEGKRRLEMKMHMKSFFMDINALTYARRRIDNQLDDSQDSMPSSRDGYPASITKVKRIDSRCLSVDWFIHDVDYVDHYEIFVDNRRHKSVFNPHLTCTILLDVNAKTSHKILMKALPRKGSGSNPNPIDQLVCDVCCGRMDRVLKGDYFCQCDKQTEMGRIKKKYEKNNCQTLVDFWKPSEFFYTPVCSCPGNCDCDCFAS
ncbi:uncharacterized protein LOC117783931 [Drosophila innubila]|uniref:uncharacterized protein LOC117783931 n=1 Tax=Drosophila innubila TaxID=198719 RepID=UPI00148C9D82|nr:uncharacterized protein LOC117783931 [Drosophila innubila]